MTVEMIVTGVGRVKADNLRFVFIQVQKVLGVSGSLVCSGKFKKIVTVFFKDA